VAHKHLESLPLQNRALEELATDTGEYLSEVILAVYNGLCEHLEVDPDRVHKRPPKKLVKGFLTGLAGIGRRVRQRIIGKRKQSPRRPFKIKGRKLYEKGKPVTIQQWKDFERQVTDHMKPFLDSVAEEMAVKGVLLGMASNEMEIQGKLAQHDKKSYEQVEREIFRGYIPDSRRSAMERFEIGNDVAAAITLAEVQAADAVQKVDERVRAAIKTQVISAHKENKSAAQLASDLYWMKRDRPELRDDHEPKPELSDSTAEQLQRDWMRVAKTELAIIHENGKLAQHEKQARESMQDDSKAAYFVFDGHPGACPECKARFGTVARLLPRGEVGNQSNDGIALYFKDDPYASIVIWQGKTNVGFRQKEWRTTVPMHPWCRCRWLRIDPEYQEYDKENLKIKLKEDIVGKPSLLGEDFLKHTDSLEARRREIMEKQQADRMEDIHKRDIDYFRRAGTKLVGYDDAGGRILETDSGLRYVEVDPSEANARLEEWRRDKSLPSPVSRAAPDWNRIFGKFIEQEAS